MYEYNWEHAAILYDNDYILWRVVGESLVQDFRKTSHLKRPYDIPFHPKERYSHKDILLEARKNARGTTVLSFMCKFLKTLKYICNQIHMIGNI